MDNSRRLTTEVPFVDLLFRRENFDVRMIDAQRYHVCMQYQKAKDCLEKILGEDNFYSDAIPLYCTVLIELK